MKTDSLPGFVTDLLLACSLLTRVPLPHLPRHAFENSARAVWAYPLAGLIPGMLAWAVASASLGLGLPAGIAAGLVLAALALVSGAMHEDGLADCADGFWGGATPERRLNIMKDSQIGSYGVLALGLVTGLRWLAYATLLDTGAAVVIAAPVLSRGMMAPVMYGLPHARRTGLSHSVGRPPAALVLLGGLFAFAIAVLMLGAAALPALLAAGCASLGVAIVARRKIAGQTGDVLGAAQQLSELSALLAIVAFTA